MPYPEKMGGGWGRRIAKKGEFTGRGTGVAEEGLTMINNAEKVADLGIEKSTVVFPAAANPQF